jgi:sulfide:quinone oxidoreductase
MPGRDRIDPLRVVVLGAGVAGLEAVLALHKLGEAQLRLTIIAPEEGFALRALAVAGPFGRGHVRRLSLADFAAEHRATVVADTAVAVDPEARTVLCRGGEVVPYDRLIVAAGAHVHPPFGHALTFDGGREGALEGILADVEQGFTKSVAFVVPRGCSWPLPLYELAMLTAEDAWGMGFDDVAVHVVTPEPRPLAMFGPQAAATVTALLDEARVVVHHGVVASVERAGQVDIGGEAPLHVDRIVTLPVVEGPALEGLPADPDGFIPVDGFGEVPGAPGVYAVGDAAAHPVKQGGLACQQADVAAAHIAAAAGAPVQAAELDPVLRGRLLTGRGERFLRRDAHGDGEIADEPLWWPPSKVSGRHLAPYLEARGLAHVPLRTAGLRPSRPERRWRQGRAASAGRDPAGTAQRPSATPSA